MSPSLDLPPIIGHRGSADLAPENTLAGIHRAHREGVTWVEFDVKLTADNIPILMHDDRLDRTTNGKGRVAEASLEDILSLDAGAWFAPAFVNEPVPTFRAALELCIELDLGVNVELKPCPGREDETARIALETLREVWPENGKRPKPLISSFDQPALAAARDAAPDLPRGCLVTRIPGRWQERFDALACTTLNVSNRWLRQRHIDVARDRNIPVLVYTVSDSVRAMTLWNMGVTSIFTDRVDLLMAAQSDR